MIGGRFTGCCLVGGRAGFGLVWGFVLRDCCLILLTPEFPGLAFVVDTV